MFTQQSGQRKVHEPVEGYTWLALQRKPFSKRTMRTTCLSCMFEHVHHPRFELGGMQTRAVYCNGRASHAPPMHVIGVEISLGKTLRRFLSLSPPVAVQFGWIALVALSRRG